ncbi:MAG: helix-turn-helix domain-containing protein [Candidatus Eremiobacteraeota bacterium]|nr:helix-turn-helix domain-containing protein [Candidatus Eremiobacteraeota bacterium]MBC5827993.1 helix-turn-helix domain-containing protein [Candidatus Eremiobacteraeota bacterium]
MRETSFFQSTRGNVVQALYRRGAATATDLALERGLTTNAVRRHLARLERDGLVAQQPKRRGSTKPSFVYSLTTQGEALFPQRYHLLLNAILDEIGRDSDEGRVTAIFRKIGERAALKHADRFAGKTAAQRVEALAKLLCEKGVTADTQPAPGGFILREHNCPYKSAVKTHPQVCSMVHALMEQALVAKPEQRTSIARGDSICEFYIPAGQNAGNSGGH